MKRLIGLLCVWGVCLASSGYWVADAVAKAKPRAQAEKKQVQHTAKNKKGRNVSPKLGVSSEGSAKTCAPRRGKRSRCKAAEAVLKSPIKEVDLDRQLVEGKDAEVRARVVPERAYAVDGASFFYQGRKFRVSGLTGDDGSEMAKQRLQRSLDVGAIELDSQGIDEFGVTTAVVRVNGKSIAELLALP